MDTYQPIYDAVRSCISNGDIGAAVQEALRMASLDHYAAQASQGIQQAAQDVAQEQMRPCVLFKPKLTHWGDKWHVSLNGNVSDLPCGTGDSPDAAMRAFDRAWVAKSTVVAA